MSIPFTVLSELMHHIPSASPLRAIETESPSNSVHQTQKAANPLCGGWLPAFSLSYESVDEFMYHAFQCTVRVFLMPDIIAILQNECP